MNFTSKKEADGKLFFLYVLVEIRLSILNICITKIYINWTIYALGFSPSPLKQKTNFVESLVHMALSLCYKPRPLQELENIKAIFRENGCPDHVILVCLRPSLNSVPPRKKLPKYTKSTKTSLDRDTSLKFQKQIETTVGNCYRATKLRVMFSITSILSAIHKNAVPCIQLSVVVYEYVYGCDLRYL